MGLTTAWPDEGAALLAGQTWHGRHAGPANAFSYRVDYVLLRLDPAPSDRFGQGRFAPVAYSDRDHGDGAGCAVDWARRIAAAHGLPASAMAETWLLTQPRRFGYVFNPVSFWFFRDAAGSVRGALAEVNNTFGDRHSYFCARDGFEPIGAGDEIVRPKRMHVSPFQDVAGVYGFRFDLAGDRIGVVIDHRADGAGGMRATLNGRVTPLDGKARWRLLFRRPLGALRVFGLIHWQALKLAAKGAPFRHRPLPPKEEVSG